MGLTEAGAINLECHQKFPGRIIVTLPAHKRERTYEFTFVQSLCSASACGHWLWTWTHDLTKQTYDEKQKKYIAPELPRDKWVGRCGLIHPEPE